MLGPEDISARVGRLNEQPMGSGPLGLAVRRAAAVMLRAPGKSGSMKPSFLPTVLATSLVALACSAAADETGPTGHYSLQKVDEKTCLTDYYHYGRGSGATRKDAEQEAIISWVIFAEWEFGSSWGRYAIAVDKGMECSNESAGWFCSAHARACRPW